MVSSHHAQSARMQRSDAVATAREPPMHAEFAAAFETGDEATILDYLDHNVDAQVALDAATARLTPPYAETHTEPLWCVPATTSRRQQSDSLFQEASLSGWLDVVAWFFCSPNRVSRWRALLVASVEGMLVAAAGRGHVHVVETLITSAVFQDLVPDDQQRTLDTALHQIPYEYAMLASPATHRQLRLLLVAHGATEAFHLGATIPVQSVLPRIATDTTEDAHFDAAVRFGRGDARDLFALYKVAPHSILFRAIQDLDVQAVTHLLSTGFVDVDARTDHDMTALHECIARGISTRSSLYSSVLAMARCLLAYHADVMLRDAHGHSALHVAILRSDYGVIYELLDCIELKHGTEAIHNDRIALELACERVEDPDDDAETVLVTLLQYGACASDAVLDAVAMRSLDVADALATHRPCKHCGQRARERKRKWDSTSCSQI